MGSVSLGRGGSVDLHAELWLWAPRAEQLRPVFPGATIVGAVFLIDGRVALSMSLPPNDERQTWLLDEDGRLHQLGPPEATSTLAVVPNGSRVAYLAQGQGAEGSTGADRLNEVWIARPEDDQGTRAYRLTGGAVDERLVDLSWVPDGEHLLLVGRYQLASGGFRTRLVWLAAASGEVETLANIPSEVVPGSYSWSPNSEHVAFLARSGQTTSLCLVKTDGSDLRYLTDLYQDDSSPLAFPPVSWSSDGSRLLYAAPIRSQPTSQGGWLWGLQPGPGLFEVRVNRPQVQRVGTAEGQSPARREDGTVVMLARPKLSGPLALRTVDPDGTVHDLGEVPIKTAPIYAATWDVAHAQAIVAVRGSASTGANRPDYWLVRFRAEANQ